MMALEYMTPEDAALKVLSVMGGSKHDRMFLTVKFREYGLALLNELLRRAESQIATQTHYSIALQMRDELKAE